MKALLTCVVLGLASATARAGGSSYSVVSVDDGELTSAGKPLSAGASLTLGEKIALSGGRAVLDAGGSGKIRIKGPAELILTGAASARVIELKLGGLLSALPRLRGSKFTVRTPQIVAAVRGTEFFVETQKNATYLCVCEGAVDARPAKGKKGAMSIEAKPDARHQSYLIKRVAGGMLADKSTMRGHHDEDFSSLHAP